VKVYNNFEKSAALK